MASGNPPSIGMGAPPIPLTVLPPVGDPGSHVGTYLKHFRIDRRINEGGMGEVYLGFDTSLSRPVAIKTLRPEVARDPGYMQRFAREAQAQANVVHPHVVQVYFAGEERGTWFMAMQLVDGGTLEDVLTRGERLSWQDAARHMLGVAEGVGEAAAQGIVHRDIKPSNLLMDRTGEAHLADFGIATTLHGLEGAEAPVSRLAPALALPTVTQVGTVLGTLTYMPPEQIQGVPLDERADMFALGASFYHLLTGVPPTDALTPEQALADKQRGVRPLRDRAKGTPRALAEVIEQCLQPTVEARFGTFVELIEALRRAAPQPRLPASPVVRTLAWALDVAPFVLVLRLTYLKAPWLAPMLFLLEQAAALRGLRATLGLWLMRLRLRTASDGDVSWGRAALRTLLVHGWLFPLSFALQALYSSSPLATLLSALTLAGASFSCLGALVALFPGGKTLHDQFTRTQVLVDVR